MVTSKYNTTPPLWIRPPRGERYRISDQQDLAQDAWQQLTGNTSATYGELVALARLGADVRIRVEPWHAGDMPRIMRIDGTGAIVRID
jgi:hypothetical protein